VDGRGPSRTAWAAANHRAAHQVLEDGAIFRDPTAVTIVGMPEPAIADDARAHPDRTPMRLFVAARHARGDEVVTAALGRGTRQVVILGAGLDTTAYRLVTPQGTTVFEVDHPTTQHRKREQVAVVGLESATALTHVGVDFEHDILSGRGHPSLTNCRVAWAMSSRTWSRSSPEASVVPGGGTFMNVKWPA
jgi:methyltransferase (TIGR00027 family)